MLCMIHKPSFALWTQDAHTLYETAVDGEYSLFSTLKLKTYPSGFTASFVAFDKALTLLNFASQDIFPTIALV